MPSLLRQTLVGIMVTLIVLLPAALVFDRWWGAEIRQERLALLPAALRQAEIVYEASAGFAPGPGGNEAGIVVYALPGAVVPTITGTDFFPTPEAGWMPWQETPADGFPRWLTTSEPSIGAFFKVELEMQDGLDGAIDSAINAPGSYITRRGWGRFMLIVPAQGRAYYAYSDW